MRVLRQTACLHQAAPLRQHAFRSTSPILLHSRHRPSLINHVRFPVAIGATRNLSTDTTGGSGDGGAGLLQTLGTARDDLVHAMVNPATTLSEGLVSLHGLTQLPYWFLIPCASAAYATACWALIVRETRHGRRLATLMSAWSLRLYRVDRGGSPGAGRSLNDFAYRVCLKKRPALWAQRRIGGVVTRIAAFILGSTSMLRLVRGNGAASAAAGATLNPTAPALAPGAAAAATAANSGNGAISTATTTATATVPGPLDEALSTEGVLWIQDLTAADPYYVLPSIATTYLAWRLAPKSMTDLRAFFAPDSSTREIRIWRMQVVLSFAMIIVNFNTFAAMWLYWISWSSTSIYLESGSKKLRQRTLKSEMAEKYGNKYDNWAQWWIDGSPEKPEAEGSERRPVTSGSVKRKQP